MKCQAYFLREKKKIRISSAAVVVGTWIFTTRWANSADNKLAIFYLFFLENRIQHFMQIGDHLHEFTKLVFWEKNPKQTEFDISCKLETICMKYQNLFSGKSKKNISICHVLKILPACLALRVKEKYMRVYTSISELQLKYGCNLTCRLLLVPVIRTWIITKCINIIVHVKIFKTIYNVPLPMSGLMANGFNFYLDVRLFGVDYVVSKLMGNGKYLAYCVKVSNTEKDLKLLNIIYCPTFFFKEFGPISVVRSDGCLTCGGEVASSIPTGSSNILL